MSSRYVTRDKSVPMIISNFFFTEEMPCVECHVEDTRNHETDRSPVISSRRSSNVSRIRWRNWTLYMIIEFIMQIQQSDGSKCYNRMIQNVLVDSYTEVLIRLEGLSSGVSQRRLFRYYLVIVSMAVVCRMSSLSYYCFWANGWFSWTCDTSKGLLVYRDGGDDQIRKCQRAILRVKRWKLGNFSIRCVDCFPVKIGCPFSPQFLNEHRPLY